MLVSPDEQSCLVVTYKEVRSCIESAFKCVLFFFYMALRLTRPHLYLYSELKTV